MDDVLHKAVIKVGEQGSEAAATVIQVKEEACLKEEDLSFDRPFIFSIEDLSYCVYYYFVWE
ncbi:serpin family protein [Clostridiaceae bacterium M8S5]|nr:serpin family protein [Clostridiaceae bacterium M8S5]